VVKELPMISRFVVAPALLASLSCGAPQTVDPDVRRRAAAIEFLKQNELEGREYVVLQAVTGVSCARQLGASPSPDVARDMLRIEAAKVGADALVAVICEETGTDWGNNCWRTIRCTGDALQWRESSSSP
jgi:hypothetical protein